MLNPANITVIASAPIPNGYESATRAGLHLSQAVDTDVGGSGGAANIIAGNASKGIVVFSGTGNKLEQNAVHGNTGIGIDLDNDGVTPNDAGDGDAGGNDLINFPVVTRATETAGTVTVDFDLDLQAGSYHIQFFTNPGGAHSSGYGEGEVYVDSTVIAHLGSGVESFTYDVPGTVGDVVTLLTTHCVDGPACADLGSTSEFSAAHTVTVPDTTAPVITLVGANPQTIEVGDPYAELGATAFDIGDGDFGDTRPQF